MRVYATADDLAEGWGVDGKPVPTDYLREASSLVEHFTSLDLYDVDVLGHPTQPGIIEAFRDATCSQVAYWMKAGVDPTAGAVGQQARVTSQSVPGGSVSYATPPTMAELGQAATELCASAYRILYNAGLGRSHVRIR